MRPLDLVDLDDDADMDDIDAYLYLAHEDRDLPMHDEVGQSLHREWWPNHHIITASIFLTCCQHILC